MTSAPGSADRVTQPWLAADLDGDLKAALAQANLLLARASKSGDLRGRVEALLAQARVLRHRGDPASLAHARSAADLASRLACLPGADHDEVLRGRTELECATCLVQGGSQAEGMKRAWDWRSAPEPRLAGWAWLVIGQALALQRDRPSAAVAALANAVAEFQRGTRGNRVAGTKILLAETLADAGQLDAASAVLGELSDWAGSEAPRRLRLGYLLALADVHYAQGDVQAAISAMHDEVNPLLNQCTDVEMSWIRYHERYAAYLRAWGQEVKAGKQGERATALRRRLIPAHGTPARPQGNPPIPAPPAPIRWADGGAPRDLPTRVHEALRGVRGPRAAQHVVELLEELQGVPDAERQEASLLVEVGERLADPTTAQHLHAERCLRRALVRLAWLPGTMLLRAQAQIALARVLAATEGPEKECPEEALKLSLAAVQTLDEQRFRMSERQWRGNWLSKAIHPSFTLAIDLANRCGRVDLAADLIVFSRASGVLAPPSEDDRSGAVSLLPVPKLHYIDGETSELGSDSECRML